MFDNFRFNEQYRLKHNLHMSALAITVTTSLLIIGMGCVETPNTYYLVAPRSTSECDKYNAEPRPGSNGAIRFITIFIQSIKEEYTIFWMNYKSMELAYYDIKIRSLLMNSYSLEPNYTKFLIFPAYSPCINISIIRYLHQQVI
ncbi:hypothetical protein BDA99DRAFT_541232 [Phascolomyces articulosus]|uniref:Uncharacterized protein n=1 Tax=Phascolomyces articulosus TaxID=60185 RepID=A0AAD5JSK9_9FUNG|nr:hypothetical protein BDA99DRAFT_541232 [Phascolomyces articulosus]